MLIRAHGVDLRHERPRNSARLPGSNESKRLTFVCLLFVSPTGPARSDDPALTVLSSMTGATLVMFGTRCREQGVESGRRRATAAVRTGDDLE